jgi:hypothetical protein
VLEAHLGEGDRMNPNSWRAALRIFEHAFDRPGESGEEEELETIDVRAMTSAQRQAAIARMLAEHPGLAALIPRTNGLHPEHRTPPGDPATHPCEAKSGHGTPSRGGQRRAIGADARAHVRTREAGSRPARRCSSRAEPSPSRPCAPLGPTARPTLVFRPPGR